MRSNAREAAFVEFATARQGDLRRVAYALCGEWQRADDLLHAALTRLYVAWPRLEREGTEEAYVRRILVRADSGGAARVKPGPPSSQQRPLVEALQSLPARQRKALLLQHWLGLSAHETAEDLGISTTSVRSNTARALAGLQAGAVLPVIVEGDRGVTGRPPRSTTTAVDLRERLEAEIGDGPPHRAVGEHLAAGRCALRRRRRTVTIGSVAGLAAVALSPLLVHQGAGPGGGGIDNRTPLPLPTSTPQPIPVHLLIAPPRYVRPDTPPVLYLFGRMFKRDRHVTVLATFGEIDVAIHPQGGAIARIGDRTIWVLVVGNEPHRLVEQREAPYSYTDFTAWAVDQLPAMSSRLALAATAPGPYHPPVPDSASPAGYAGDRLVARPGGTVVQRVEHPLVNRTAVRPCHDEAVRVHTATRDWFVLGYDCAGQGALYSEPVGVRAGTLSSWLVQVKRAQDTYVG